MEYVEFNNNPKGKKTTDCVLRAISFAMEKDYIETYKDMVEFSIKKGIFISDNKFSKTYLKSKNIETQKMPRRNDNTRYTVREFADEIAENGKTYILSIAHHLTVIKDKKLYDIWNCGHKSVGNYWILNSNDTKNITPKKENKRKKRVVLY